MLFWQCPHRLGGVVSVAGSLPAAVPCGGHKANRGIQTLLLHGTDQDEAVGAEIEVAVANIVDSVSLRPLSFLVW